MMESVVISSSAVAFPAAANSRRGTFFACTTVRLSPGY